MREILLKHEFVEFVPTTLAEGIIYVSIPYGTAAHKCCCGCGSEIVTPITPTDWKIIYDGATVSLDPSIGNWNLPCKSHYWITKNKVEWAPKWSTSRIEWNRDYDKLSKEEYFRERKSTSDEPKGKDNPKKSGWFKKTSKVIKK